MFKGALLCCKFMRASAASVVILARMIPTRSSSSRFRLKHEAPEQLTESCGHPKLSLLDLVVTPISGCKGFKAVEAQA